MFKKKKTPLRESLDAKDKNAGTDRIARGRTSSGIIQHEPIFN